MPVTAAQISSAVQEAQGVGDAILKTIEGLDPAAAVEAATIGGVVDLTEDLVEKALGAWSAASGQPITVQSVLALLPNQTPLTPPDPV
jgi:hypothetical protein